MVKNLPANAGDAKRCRFDPCVRKIPGGRNGNLLQYSCLENSMNRGAWWAAVHEVAKNWHDYATKYIHTTHLNALFKLYNNYKRSFDHQFIPFSDSGMVCNLLAQEDIAITCPKSEF